MTEQSEDARTYAEAFELVQNALRVGIVRELARAQAAAPRAPHLRFSELRERLDRPDSGTFNYHLDRLRGRFVAKTGEGYVLTAAGHRLAAAIAAGVYGADVERRERDLDESCPLCAASLSVAYDDGTLSVTCPNDHGIVNLFPAGAVVDRSLEAARALFDRVTRQQVDLAVDGACPLCYAATTTAVVDREDVPDRAGRWGVEALCERCGAIVSVPVPLALGGHPVVEALLTATGVDPRRRHVWGGTADVDWTVESREPGPVLDVSVTHADVTAAFTVDGDATVTVERTPDWLSWRAPDAARD